MKLIVNKNHGLVQMSDNFVSAYLRFKNKKIKDVQSSWCVTKYYLDDGTVFSPDAFDRTDELLMKVINIMPDCTSLKVVTIPDNYKDKYTILDYDGIETVVKDDYILEEPYKYN